MPYQGKKEEKAILGEKKMKQSINKNEVEKKKS